MINRITRALRIRNKIKKQRKIRLFIYKSNKYIYLYIINDNINKILFSVSSYSFKNILKNTKNILSSKLLSIKLLIILKSKNINNIIFDKSGYKYHGNIKIICDILKINKVI